MQARVDTVIFDSCTKEMMMTGWGNGYGDGEKWVNLRDVTKVKPTKCGDEQ